jgi:hypothetical protein
MFFWVLALVDSSALKMETVCFSETLASTDESTRLQNPEDHHHHHLHRRENLKSHVFTNIYYSIYFITVYLDSEPTTEYDLSFLILKLIRLFFFYSYSQIDFQLT